MDVIDVDQRSTFLRPGRGGQGVLPGQYLVSQKEEWYSDLYKIVYSGFILRKYSRTLQATLLDSAMTDIKEGWVKAL